MKKTFLLIVMALVVSCAVNAQSVEKFESTWPEKHVILQAFLPMHVMHVENWCPEYLTVTELYNYSMFLKVPKTLKVLSVITEINGKSTKGMSTNEFNKILADSTDIMLKYITKVNGKNQLYTSNIQKYKGFGLIEYWRKSNAFWPKGGVLSDADIDYFQYNTYDYVLNDDADQLEQKKLLGAFAEVLDKKGLKRDRENPDLYLYVTLYNDKKIETVYQPRQVTRSSSDSYGRVSTYSYSRSKDTYSRLSGNTNTTTVTEDQGAMRTYVSTDAYMQITVLDAKNTDKATAPKIWQYTFDERLDYVMKLSDYESKIRYYGQMYPLGDDGHYVWRRYSGRDDDHDAYYYGMYVYGKEITGIVPGSFGEKNGIKVGDTLKTDNKGYVYSSSVLFRIGNKYTILEKMGKTVVRASMFKNPTATLTRKDYEGTCPFIHWNDN